MKDAEQIREYIRKALEPVYSNEKYGKPLAHDPVFARFWEGRMIEIGYHKKNLETILDMLKD